MPDTANTDLQNETTTTENENMSDDSILSPPSVQTMEPLEMAQPTSAEEEIQYPTGIKLYIILAAVGLALTVSGLVSTSFKLQIPHVLYHHALINTPQGYGHHSYGHPRYNKRLQIHLGCRLVLLWLPADVLLFPIHVRQNVHSLLHQESLHRKCRHL